MKVKEKKWIRFRIYLIAVFFLLGMGVVLARAYQLQIVERDRLEAMASAGYKGIVTLPPERGVIYDREGHELALSVEVNSIYAHPNQVKEKSKAARAISRVLDERRSKVLRLLKKDRSFVWVKRRVSPDEAEKIKTLNLDGVGITKETRRYYPGREIASHLIGFVGYDNQGLEGLEKKYDKLLRGPEFRLMQMRDALGRPFFINRAVSSVETKHDIHLTIDKDLQYKAQEALGAAVNRAKAKVGHCLILNPETGEVLAMAIAPGFNPNIFSKYKPYQWRNRIVTDCFEPGSTLKAFLLAASLEENVVSPLTNFNCMQGKYEIAGHVIHDTHKYGTLSVSDIIAFSSNIGAAKIGANLGYKMYSDYLKEFGFGRKTNIGLLGERNGFLRSAKTVKPIEEITLFFGQGITITSIQLAMAMSAIANGGKLMRPYVVKKIVDSSGNTVEKTHPEMIRRVISQRTARRVSSILEGVVGENGTGVEAAIEGFQVAGKTGTAQKVDSRTRRYSKTNYVATFVGFVPSDRPKLVILVMIDEPKGIPYGGIVAGPVFKEVGKWSLNYLRVNPRVRFAKSEHDPSDESSTLARLKQTREPDPDGTRVDIITKKGRLPNFRGMSIREVLRKGKALGLNMNVKGTGLAVRQYPDPGYPLKRITSVKVSFKPPA